MDIKLIAQNAVRIVNKNGKVIYFDPFELKGEYLNDADMIFITHSHYDHFSPKDVEQIKNDNTKIIVTKDLTDKVINIGFKGDSILTVLPNNEYEFSGIKFRTIPAYNINKQFHKKEYEWVSYIIEIDDDTVYIAGDTDITDEAKNVKCDIACVPVGGIYTMTAEEAAELIEYIHPNKLAIPTHYKTVVGSIDDAVIFKELLNGKVKVEILMK